MRVSVSTALLVATCSFPWLLQFLLGPDVFALNSRHLVPSCGFWAPPKGLPDIWKTMMESTRAVKEVDLTKTSSAEALSSEDALWDVFGDGTEELVLKPLSRAVQHLDQGETSVPELDLASFAYHGDATTLSSLTPRSLLDGLWKNLITDAERKRFRYQANMVPFKVTRKSANAEKPSSVGFFDVSSLEQHLGDILGDMKEVDATTGLIKSYYSDSRGGVSLKSYLNSTLGDSNKTANAYFTTCLNDALPYTDTSSASRALNAWYNSSLTEPEALKWFQSSLEDLFRATGVKPLFVGRADPILARTCVRISSSAETSVLFHSDPFHNYLFNIQGGPRRILLAMPASAGALYPAVVENGKDPQSGARIFEGQVKPRALDLKRHPNSKHAKVLYAFLNPGDALYIPAGWWHYVEASGTGSAAGGEKGMEFKGMSLALNTFMKDRDWEGLDTLKEFKMIHQCDVSAEWSSWFKKTKFSLWSAGQAAMR